MNNDQTIFSHRGEKPPRLFIYCQGQVDEYPLAGRQSFGRPARKSAPDIPARSMAVSRVHGQFECQGPYFRYTDLGSANGTLLDGKALPPNAPRLLDDGDVLRVHGIEDDAREMDVVMVVSASYHEGTRWERLVLGPEVAEVAVGRSQSVELSDASVSRRHASFFNASGGWAVIDHGSLNGVYLNGHRLSQPRYLQLLDVVDISGYLFIYTGNELFYQADTGAASTADGSSVPKSHIFQPASPVGTPAPVPSPEPPVVSPGYPGTAVSGGQEVLSVWIEERSVWSRMKKKTLLKDIRLDISSGQMVLVLGGSGAGKTTFVNAVMGFEPAEGSISYNDTDIYAEYEKMKYEIGYVPQKDLLRLGDTVIATLRNAAGMRLPAKLRREEYDEAVERAIAKLGLDRVRDSLAGKLSGGQLKRLSIAVEYIGNPSLFFLDEPDSGLDGVMARSLMENLRSIADDGRIVIVISHSPDRAFDLWDKVIVLARDSREDCGRLAFYGSPKEACAFFDADSLEGIVRRINLPDEGGEGLADHYIEAFAKRSEAQ